MHHRPAPVGLAIVALAIGCSSTMPALNGHPYDAVIVPGCPSEKDGSLSECQSRRTAWATILWERGLARTFITSGSAVHSPYVEAELMAAAMTAMGVPADRIYLDPDALHTDENMYNSMRIARRLGLHHLAVASDRGQAWGGCRMVNTWQQRCTALPMEPRAAHARVRADAEKIRRVRTVKVATFRALAELERERRKRTGRRRPPSALLYPWMWVLRVSGGNWVPLSPAPGPIARWSDRVSPLAGSGEATPRAVFLPLPAATAALPEPPVRPARGH